MRVRHVFVASRAWRLCENERLRMARVRASTCLSRACGVFEVRRSKCHDASVLFTTWAQSYLPPRPGGLEGTAQVVVSMFASSVFRQIHLYVQVSASVWRQVQAAFIVVFRLVSPFFCICIQKQVCRMCAYSSSERLFSQGQWVIFYCVFVILPPCTAGAHSIYQ